MKRPIVARRARPRPVLLAARRVLFAPRFERGLDDAGALVTLALWSLLGSALAITLVGASPR
jgi:hypothetical protein